ncbi:manganese efflux pump MntP family protein [Spirulina subsalsa]|uniref:manganese efflux pump MntP n=1 Tax=Spirulina subsalsa TaxID=54311 RepID=UPI0002E5FBC5|nr:manganese efflux pump MntP family protein [Spirulina subsalsa]
MEFSTIGLIALGLSADAFAVSISSGLFIRNIKVNKALKIALFFGGLQMIMPLVGWEIARNFREFFSYFSPWIAFILLSFIGSKMVYEALAKVQEEEKKFNPLDNYTLLILAIATSIDALVAGVSFSLLEVALIPVVTIIGMTTFSLCFCGVLIGHHCGDLFRSKVELIGGLLLIAIGVKILLENIWVVGG